MNTIQQWTAGICLAVLALSLVQYLMPEGALHKTAELAAGAFFLCAVLIPVLQAAPDFSFLFSLPSLQPSESLQDTVEEQKEDTVSRSVSSLAAAELARDGIPVKEVETTVHTQEDGSICITSVRVTIPASASSQCDRAAELLSASLGLEVEVKTDAGTDGA